MRTDRVKILRDRAEADFDVGGTDGFHAWLRRTEEHRQANKANPMPEGIVRSEIGLAARAAACDGMRPQTRP
jgi:hypothetical protein